MLLENLAEEFGMKVEIIMRGFPDVTLPDFHHRTAKRENMHYLGRYVSPDDLNSIYEDVDLIWAGDYHDAGFNSKWLLPNRLYEGGYFATPVLIPSDCESGRWADNNGAGFTIQEPVEHQLSAVIQDLIRHPRKIIEKCRHLQNLPDDIYLQPADEMDGVISAAQTVHRNACNAHKFSRKMYKIQN